ncbi:MAG: sugar phosphate isomerase/epimerase [Zavarzinella sp.]
MNHTTDRRTMLRTATGLALGTLGLGFTTSHVGAADNKDFAGFPFGVQSYTFRKFNLEQCLKRIQDVGLHYVEFYRGHVPTTSTPEQIKSVVKLCKDYEVSPIAFGVESFTKNTDANKKIFEFAAALGVKHLSADPTPDSFDSLDKLVEEYKISIAIHPHGPSGKGRHRWWSATTILAAVKDHHPLIGTCLDTGHLIRMAQLGETLDPAKEIEIMGARNFGLHLKDHDNKKKTDVIYGQAGGVLDVQSVLNMLKKVQFKGYISIEYEAKADEPTTDVKELVKIVKATCAKLN